MYRQLGTYSSAARSHHRNAKQNSKGETKNEKKKILGIKKKEKSLLCAQHADRSEFSYMFFEKL